MANNVDTVADELVIALNNITYSTALTAVKSLVPSLKRTNFSGYKFLVVPVDNKIESLTRALDHYMYVIHVGLLKRTKTDQEQLDAVALFGEVSDSLVDLTVLGLEQLDKPEVLGIGDKDDLRKDQYMAVVQVVYTEYR